jgi:hypothetical protein
VPASQRKEIVAIAPNSDAKLDGGHCAILAEDDAALGQVGGCLESELCRVTRATQLLGLQSRRWSGRPAYE